MARARQVEMIQVHLEGNRENKTITHGDLNQLGHTAWQRYIVSFLTHNMYCIKAG